PSEQNSNRRKENDHGSIHPGRGGRRARGLVLGRSGSRIRREQDQGRSRGGDRHAPGAREEAPDGREADGACAGPDEGARQRGAPSGTAYAERGVESFRAVTEGIKESARRSGRYPRGS